MNATGAAVSIARGAINRAIKFARDGLPAECCGVLLGRAYAILRASPVRNRAVGPDRFDAEPLDLIDAERTARAAGLRVLGYFHSHPNGDATPSEHDRAGVVWPDLPPYFHLIVTPQRRWALYDARNGEWRCVRHSREPLLIRQDRQMNWQRSESTLTARG